MIDKIAEEGKLLGNIVQQIRQEIGRVESMNEFYDLRCLNGFWHLTIKGEHNHRDDRPIEFFKWVAKVSPGSFGLL